MLKEMQPVWLKKLHNQENASSNILKTMAFSGHNRKKIELINIYEQEKTRDLFSKLKQNLKYKYKEENSHL